MIETVMSKAEVLKNSDSLVFLESHMSCLIFNILYV